MSSQGQIDPVMALAQQQQPPQQMVPQAQGEIDPVQALAMGQQVAAPQQAPAPANSNDWADPKGYISSIVRNFGNAASFNLADPAAAALGAAMPIKGYTSTKPTYGERFGELLKLSRGDTAAGQQANPITSLGASVAGGMLNPATRALPAATSLGAALGQGAGLGAAYGAGGAIGNSNDIGDALKQTAVGAGTGLVAGGASYGLGKLIAGATRTPAAQLLSDEGVNLTPGQSLGGTAQTLEDSTTHLPMLGNAIKGRQADAISDFNRAGYNRALEPLGIQYDPKAPIGNEGIDSIGKTIGDAYDRAYSGASISKTPTVLNAIDSATDDAANLLPKDKVSQIQANINRLITSKFDENGVLNSDDLETAKNFFAEQSRAGPNASLEDRAAAGAYGKVVDGLKAGISETDPERGALLNAADTSYMRFSRLAQAASSNNASGKGGIFTPAQLGNALRSMDNSTRRMNFAKGLAPMQDLVQAGQQVLPSTVPDSGTAIRGLMDAAPWLGAAAVAKPEAAIAGAAGLGAGTALYSRPGQKLAQALLFGAPGARKAMAQIPQTMLPGFLAALSASGSGNKP